MNKELRNKDSGNFLIRYVKSFLHAIDGIKYSVINEHNMIIILLATIVVIIAGCYYNISSSEWLFVLTMIGAVSASEFINTAIEALTDLITLDYNPLAKIAKDTASSATLVLCIISFVGAIVIFLPYMI